MNSVHCTSGLPCRAIIKRKAASVTPSMGERPMIGCGSVGQKLMRPGCPLPRLDLCHGKAHVHTQLECTNESDIRTWYLPVWYSITRIAKRRHFLYSRSHGAGVGCSRSVEYVSLR